MYLTRIDEWKAKTLFEKIRNELKNMGCQEGDEEFPYAAVLLASAVVGADPRCVAQVTGYSQDFINEIDNRMRGFGIWVGNSIDMSEWEEGDGFIVHLLVARGAVGVVPGSMPRRYMLQSRCTSIM